MHSHTSGPIPNESGQGSWFAPLTASFVAVGGKKKTQSSPSSSSRVQKTVNA